MKTFLLTAIAVAAMAAWAFADERVGTIDAVSYAGKDVTVTADKVEVATKDKKESLARGDVAEIDLAKGEDLMSKRAQAVLLTTDGGKLAVKNLMLEKSKFSFDSTLVGHAEMPIDAVSAVFESDPNMSPQQIAAKCAELKFGGGTKDSVVVSPPSVDWTSAEGVLKGVAADKVAFNIENEDKTVDRKLVRVIFVAGTGTGKNAIIGTVKGVDGSILPFTSLTMDDKAVTVDLPGLGNKKLSRADVAAVRFTSDRVANLADLKPTEVKEYGFLDRTFGFRANRSVSGKPLVLGGETFATGLGLHSYCELTFKVEGFSKLVAVAGIDDAARPGGDATLTFLGNGKELDKPLRLTGKDAPATVRVDLKGAKTLTIRVDFGEDKLDVSDHVDLGAARLVK